MISLLLLRVVSECYAEIYFRKFNDGQVLPSVDSCYSGEVLKRHNKIHLVNVKISNFEIY